MRSSSRAADRAFWIAVVILGFPLIVALVLLASMVQSRAPRAVRPVQAASPTATPAPTPLGVPGWRAYEHATGRFSLYYPAHLFELASEDQNTVVFRRGESDLSAGLYENFCQLGAVSAADALSCLAGHSAALARYEARGYRLVHKRLRGERGASGYEVEYLLAGEVARMRVTALYVRLDDSTMVAAHLARPDVRSTEQALVEERGMLDLFMSSIRVQQP